MRWLTLGTGQDGGWGEARSPRADNVTLPSISLRREQRGGVAGAEPPHKGGPNRPDRTTAVISGQWSVVSGQWLVVSG